MISKTNLNRLILLFIVFLLSVPEFSVFAQDVSSSGAQSGDVEMADLMRSSGKIYVVVGVLAIVLAGFLFYLSLLDRKIRRLEKELDK